MKPILIAATALALTACGGSTAPLVKVSTPTTVVIGNATSDNRDDTLNMAQNECQQYGKSAVEVHERIRDYNATFSCQ